MTCSPGGSAADGLALLRLHMVLATVPDGSPPALILNDCDTYAGLKHHFLAGYSVAGQEHLHHLTSSGRLAFYSTLISDVHAIRRMRGRTAAKSSRHT